MTRSRVSRLPPFNSQCELPKTRPSSARDSFVEQTLVRRRVEANDRLMRNYFSENPTYNERLFRQRFRMSKRLFFKISGDLEAEYPYFQQRYNASGKLGFSAIQKCTSALRQLATGQTGDLFDEYLEMSERTSRETLEKFCRGSIGCMHWAWDMCPTAWRGTHTRGDVGHPSLMLQAVASYDLWIWNAYFGKQGSNNDINVFESSPVLEEIISGLAPTNREVHNMLKADLVDHLWANRRRGDAQPDNDPEFNIIDYVSDEE
uniref:uncharacterized protein LOC122590855 n=1 Tax=Erigeron canadensis TaxID=72917 RepID=UPI001CB9447E|nr:uncharacterized protein LOC122590855 [Erigeron canadensis]